MLLNIIIEVIIINEKYKEDMELIKTELWPSFLDELEKNEIDMKSTVFFFAGAVKEMLNEIDDKSLKEVIIKYMFD